MIQKQNDSVMGEEPPYDTLPVTPRFRQTVCIATERDIPQPTLIKGKAVLLQIWE